MNIRNLVFTLLGLSISLACITKVSAQLSILDDFSTNSSSDYNIIDAFNASGAYGISNNSFAPTQPAAYGTTYFLRNTGEYLSASGGQSVSIDISAIGTSINEGYLDGAGLGFSTSLASDQNGNELLLTQDNSNQCHLGSLGRIVGPYITNGFSLANGTATLTITREATNPTLFYYALTGGGLAQPAAEGTLTYPSSAGLPVYFGMAVTYSPYDSATSIREDDLSFGVQGAATNNNSIPIIQNPSFEIPSVTNTMYAFGTWDYYYFSYQIDPANADWIFTGLNNNAGIAANGSGCSYYQAGTTNGTQYAWLEGKGGVGASMSQTISNFPAGSYSFTFNASQRDRVGRDNSTNQTVTVLVDGISVGSFTPADTNWYSFQTEPIFVNAGNHTLTFTNLPVPGDAMILIDNVGIQQTASTNSTNAPGSNIIASFSPIPNQVYGVGPFSIIPPAASSGLPVTLSVLSGPAILSNNVITITGVGTVVLAANQSGNANYSPAAEVTTSFAVTPANQTIASFAPIPNQVSGIPFTITSPTASSGLPVTVTVQSGPAVISNNTVTPTGAGIVVLAANQPGNNNYSAAAEVTTRFAVKNFSQTIAPFHSIRNKIFGDAPFRITPPDASSRLPVVVTVQSGPATILHNVVTLTGAGTVVLAANQAGDPKFIAAPEITTSFSVAKAYQRLFFPEITIRKHAPTAIQLDAKASSGLAVTYSVLYGPASVSGNSLILTGPGRVAVEAEQAGDFNYNPAAPVTRILKGL